MLRTVPTRCDIGGSHRDVERNALSPRSCTPFYEPAITFCAQRLHTKELGEDYLDERRRDALIRYHTKRLHELNASV